MRVQAARTAAAGLVLALIAAAFLVVSIRLVNIYDEGIILTGAARVLHGAVPYRDFYTNYGPGQFAVLALLFKWFGPSVLVERAWDALVRAAIVALIFAIARRLSGRATAFTAGLAAFVWLGKIGLSYGYPLLPALAGALAALACLVGTGARRPLAAGILLGATAAFRFDIGFACLAATIAGLGASIPVKQWRWELPWVCAGFAIVVVPILLWLDRAGALPLLWFDVVRFPARAYAATRSLPFPGFARVWDDPLQLSVFLPPLACVLGLAMVVAGGQRARCIVLIVLFTAVLYAKGWVRMSPLHTIGGFTVMLLLLTQWRRVPPAALPLLAVVLAGLATCLEPALRQDWRAGRENLAWAARADAWARPAGGVPEGYDTCRMPPGLRRLDCISVDASRGAAILYVRSHSGPADALFVGLPRHDRIFANDVAFYFEAARRPATRWYHFDPRLQTSLPIQAEMIREIERAKPKLIVIESLFQNVDEPNASGESSGIHLLDAYLSGGYRAVAAFGPFSIRERRRG